MARGINNAAVARTGPDKSAQAKNPSPEFVTQEVFDQFARAVGRQFSEMREEYEQRIQDLENVVSAGDGVVFGEVRREEPEDNTPWYNAGP